MATEDIRERLARLPHHAVVAFAARCARRVQPLTHVLPQQGRDVIDRALASAEAFAKGAAAARADDARADARAVDAWVAARADARADAADVAAAWAAHAANWADTRAAAASDLDRLIALNPGEPDALGAPIDPSEAGPLGPLWPQGCRSGTRRPRPGPLLPTTNHPATPTDPPPLPHLEGPPITSRGPRHRHDRPGHAVRVRLGEKVSIAGRVAVDDLIRRLRPVGRLPTVDHHHTFQGVHDGPGHPRGLVHPRQRRRRGDAGMCGYVEPHRRHHGLAGLRGGGPAALGLFLGH